MESWLVPLRLGLDLVFGAITRSLAFRARDYKLTPSVLVASASHLPLQTGRHLWLRLVKKKSEASDKD